MVAVAGHDLGAGFIPRITAKSRPGVMEALGQSDLFTKADVSVPYVIAEAPLAIAYPHLGTSLASLQVKMIVDTQAWRFSDDRTWKSKWVRHPYAPRLPFNPTKQWVTGYVAGDLAHQVAVGGRCLMLPGWFSSIASVDLATDVATWTIDAFRQFRRGGVILPAIAWLPLHVNSSDASLAAARVYAQSGTVKAIYGQLSRMDGLSEPSDELIAAASLMLDVQSLGLPVIAGHMGAFGLVLRALGIVAADCGPNSAQSFNHSELISRSARQRPAKGGGIPVRMWVGELHQAVTAQQMAAIRADRTALAEVLCRRPCHRFRPGPENLLAAVQHSALALIDEAERHAGQAGPIRVDAARRTLLEARSRITRVDQAVRRSGARELKRDHVDNQLALLARFSHPHGAVS